MSPLRGRGPSWDPVGYHSPIYISIHIAFGDKLNILHPAFIVAAIISRHINNKTYNERTFLSKEWFPLFEGNNTQGEESIINGR